MKKCAFLLAVALIVGMFAGCVGTPVVYYSDCTCPTGSHNTPAATPSAPSVSAEGQIRTGLYLGVSVSDSTAGTASYDVTLAAVTVDKNDVILSCKLDSIGTSVTFENGTITSDLSAAILSKNELGDDYGMVAWGGATAEWYQQAQALANYAVGKTPEQLRSGAIDETGYAADADLATSATIYLGGYVSAIEGAVANAQVLGAQDGDELRLAAISSISDSTDVADGQDGTAQLNVDVAVLTVSGDTITSCYIDSVQAKVTFDVTDAITSDLTASIATKNQLGDDYGMVAWGGATYEWYQQAANFSAYVTGKTASDVAGIAISESTKPADGTDLASSVTISIAGFQQLIAKAIG